MSKTSVRFINIALVGILLSNEEETASAHFKRAEVVEKSGLISMEVRWKNH